MSFELTSEQAVKGDILLNDLCTSEAVFGREEAGNLFDSDAESNFICLYLAEKGMINIIGKTENNPLYAFVKTDKTSGFLNNGGLSKLSRRHEQILQKEKYDFQLSKWKSKTFWWFFVFGFIGFGFSLYNLINSLLN